MTSLLFCQHTTIKKLVPCGAVDRAPKQAIISYLFQLLELGMNSRHCAKTTLNGRKKQLHYGIALNVLDVDYNDSIDNSQTRYHRHNQIYGVVAGRHSDQ